MKRFTLTFGLFIYFLTTALPTLAALVDESVLQVVAGDAKSLSNDHIQTGERGVKLEIKKTHTVIEVAPRTEVKLALAHDPESIELISGIVRAHVEKKINAKDSKPKFILKSRTATMGVRGTDFMGVVTPVLDESEIIVFEGNVDFASNADASDVKHVPAGHWGGIGGRFGAKTHELMKLSKEALSYFDQASSVK